MSLPHLRQPLSSETVMDRALKFRIIITLFAALAAVAFLRAEKTYAAPSAITEDEFSDTQWTLDNGGSFIYYDKTGSRELKTTKNVDIDAPEGWNLLSSHGYGRRQVVVAVIDTGVDFQHPDLRGKIWVNPDEFPGDNIDNDGNGYVDDVYGWDFYNNDSSVCHYSFDSKTKKNIANANDCDDHGTHCAGIIAATSDNKTGIAGVASPVDVKIMILKIHGGANKKGSIASAVKAIKYAQMMGADICNISWGTYGDCPSLLSAIKESNMLFVCAAGNDGTDNDSKPLYPASFDLDNVISVGYTDWEGELSTKSNFGKSSVDVAIPSVHVYSTTVGGYDYMSGSSMAAPHVTGLAALIYSYGDGITAKAVKSLITNNVKKRSGLADVVRTGGIPSASNIFAKSPSFAQDFTKPTLQVTRTFDKDKLLLKIKVEDTGSGVHSVRYFVGDKSLKDFAHGTAGTLVEGKTLALSKGGYVTFYVDDKAGNEIAKIIYLSDDESSPVYSDMSFTVADSYESITVKGKVSDPDSGIKAVKYLPGSHNISDFSAAGTAVEFKKSGKFTFDVTMPGQYTIYASDWRGNKEIYRLNTKIVKAENLTVSREKKTLTKGKSFKIKYEVAPADTTDKITFTSSDEKVATVSAKGKVTAVGRGRCTITVRTSSGAEAEIEIRVKKANP